MQRTETSSIPQGSRSLWMESAPSLEISSLPTASEFSTDVCIVGGGIAGLTTAYLLAKEGLKVIVLEKGDLGRGETGRTTAHLSNALDDRYINLEKWHGKEKAWLAAHSHTQAINKIEQMIKEEKIECDFIRLDGYLFAPPSQNKELLEQEWQAAHRMGLTQVKKLPKAPWSDFDTGLCLQFPNQGQLHPLRYIAGLSQAVLRAGGQIFKNAYVSEFQGGKQAYVKTQEGTKVNAAVLVIATNTPVNDKVMIHTKQVAYRSYVIGATIPKGTVPQALYWDTENPYHYVRLAPHPDKDKEMLVVGGEDHRTGEHKNISALFTKLENWTKERFPQLQSIAYRWSGQIMEPVDGLAFIGRNPGDYSNVYVATGDSGHGMTHGTIAGMLLTDCIAGRENPWKTLYHPARHKFRSTWEYVKENVSTGASYFDWFRPGKGEAQTRIPAGKGTVLRKRLKRVAVFRDEQGKLEACSAVCTHLSGLVRFNEFEKSWDCPCHGSRFDVAGNVLNGPANQPLEKEDVGLFHKEKRVKQEDQDAKRR